MSKGSSFVTLGPLSCASMLRGGYTLPFELKCNMVERRTFFVYLIAVLGAFGLGVLSLVCLFLIARVIK